MPLKVALSGPHGVGKTYIVEEVASRLREEGHSVYVVPSMTRALKGAGYPINLEGPEDIWITQFVCGALRDFQEGEVFNTQDVDVILSDRWLLDEYVYTRYFVKQYQLLILEQVATLLSTLVLARQGRWDRRFLKMPHPDYLPEEDGHRDPDVEFQKGITEAFEELDIRDGLLPLDRDDAADVVYEYIRAELRERDDKQ